MPTKRAAISQGVKVLMQRFGGVLLYLLASGWVTHIQVTIYFSFYLLSAVLALVIVFLVTPRALAIRENNISLPTPTWDKIILTTYYLLSFYLIYLIAGLESSAGNEVTKLSFWLGMAFNLLSFGVALWAMLVNPFMESQARVQSDRQQQVISQGPYAIVRHPTYLAIVLWTISIILIFGTLFTRLTALIILILIILRTYLEDRMLFHGLTGYKEYCEKTKWRLIPFIF